MLKPWPVLAVLSLFVLSLGSADGGDAGLGEVDFPTSGPAPAQRHFLRGVAALHNFAYELAREELRAARESAPGFAMATWGEAMTYEHPTWGDQDEEGARRALAQLGATPGERAAKAPTERERAYLAAVEALFGEGELEQRRKHYAAAMERLYVRYPEDLEAGCFYALALLATVPRSGRGDEALRPRIQAAAILEDLYLRNRRHPGVLHYLIHAYDDPVHAPLGLRAALAYARVAPASSHALHMPSHIFVQLGRWAEAAAANEAAWAASVIQVESRQQPGSHRDFHNLEWLQYAYLQQGRYRKAAEALALARRAAGEGDREALAYVLPPMEARQVLETGGGPGASLPADDPARLVAYGLAAAAHGDLGGAERAQARLHALAGGPPGTFRARAGAIYENEVAARLLLARNRPAEALARLAEAVAAEDRLPLPSGPPLLVALPHEEYGKALLATGRPAEAAEQFARALERSPGRAAALLGAARAAARLGDRKADRRAYAALAAVWREADTDIAAVGEVRRFLQDRQ